VLLVATRGVDPEAFFFLHTLTCTRPSHISDAKVFFELDGLAVDDAANRFGHGLSSQFPRHFHQLSLESKYRKGSWFTNHTNGMPKQCKGRLDPQMSQIAQIQKYNL